MPLEREYRIGRALGFLFFARQGNWLSFRHAGLAIHIMRSLEQRRLGKALAFYHVWSDN